MKGGRIEKLRLAEVRGKFLNKSPLQEAGKPICCRYTYGRKKDRVWEPKD
jgi:hypothetical protein